MSGIGKYKKRTWTRADGTVVESPHYTIEFPYLGMTRRETTTATTEVQAKAALLRKLEEIGRGEYVPDQNRVTLATLVEHLEASYQTNDKRSWQTALDKLKAVLDWFGRDRRVTTITVSLINRYKAERLALGKARATVNGELRYLRRLFSVGIEDEILSHAPVIKLLDGENKRDGFADPGDFYAVLSHFRDQDVADLVEWLYWAGCRAQAGARLEWKHLNNERSTVILTAALSKNKQALELPLNAKLGVVLDRRRAKRRLDCPFVFHRDGQPIKNFRKAWLKAASLAGLPNLLVHDLCRSAARNLARSGVDESVASKYMNRKSLTIYRQYRIVNSDDLARAGASLDRLEVPSGKVRRIV